MKFFMSLIFLLSLINCTGGSPQKSGGIKDVFFYGLWGEPGDLHPVRANDSYMYQIVTQHTYYPSNVVEGLLSRDLDTYELKPNLAERFEVSKDGKTFTFYLRKDVKFHDGSNMTAEDVKFSFDMIFDDKFEAYVARSFYSNFKGVEIIDKYTVKVEAKSSYFLNLSTIGELMVLPKATYGKQSESNRLAKTVLGSGPYKFKSWNKGRSLTLESNPDWWGHSVEGLKDKYNFKTIIFKFVKEATLRQAMLEKGTLDFDYRLREENFVKKMSGKMWGNSVLKVKADNRVPKNLTYIGWNNNHKILGDKKVRRALTHLVNRNFLNERFYYNMKVLSTGPFRVASAYANPHVKPFKYDPEKAKKILTEAGWVDSDKDGVLDKTIDGVKTKFKFTLTSATKDSEKLLTTIKEDMKKAGVEMVINIIDWNALIKANDERKFDATIMSWGGGGVDPDPTQIWHSKSAEGTGSNYISYKNSEVDKLIERGINIVDKSERIKVFHKIHKIIAEDCPYTFLFEQKYQLYAVNARVKRSSDTRPYSIGAQYWALPE